jgi:hypothetical protein
VEHTVDADVFIYVWPVNSLTVSDNFEVCTLCGRRLRKPPRPRQRDTEDPAINEISGDRVELTLMLRIPASELTTMLMARLDNAPRIRLDQPSNDFLIPLLLKTSEYLFRCDREIADADASGVVYGVGDGRGYGHERRLA